MVGGRQPSVEDDEVCGRRHLVEDNLKWNTTFGGRQPLAEDDLQWKMTFSGRQPLVDDDVQRKTTFGGSLHATYSSLQPDDLDEAQMF